MIEQIKQELLKTYPSIIFKFKNGDYDLYYNGLLTNISITNGSLGGFDFTIRTVKRELDYFLSAQKGKINTEDKNGVKELSVRSGNRGRRKHRKDV